MHTILSAMNKSITPMRRIPYLVMVVGVIVGLGGCAGVGIAASQDPFTKLNDAQVLFSSEDRPLPAERLIREALAIYEERDDPHGLGNAHREYGDLLRSPAVARHETIYRRDGFLDKSITFENRFSEANDQYRAALRYYRRAIEKEPSKYDALTNIYYNMALIHLTLGEAEQACGDYDQTLEAYNKNIAANPSAKPNVPPNLAGWIEAAKRRAGC